MPFDAVIVESEILIFQIDTDTQKKFQYIASFI